MPGSIGEVISSFRDDTQIILTMLALICFTSTQALFAFIAFIILLHVNVQITLQCAGC